MRWLFTRLNRGLDGLSGWFVDRPRAARSAVLATILVSWVSAIVLAWFTWDLLSAIPDRDHLRHVSDMAQATTLLDRPGPGRLHHLQGAAHRGPAGADLAAARQGHRLDRGSAFLRAPGRRHRAHCRRRASTNLRAGRRAQGGSTLTQQLARQSVPDTRQDVSSARSRRSSSPPSSKPSITKDEILELYLNKVYFGDGLHGVEAASLGFFGKHASDLLLSEAALHRRPGEVALQPTRPRSAWNAPSRGATSCCRRCASSGAVTAKEADAARADPVRLKTRSAATSPTAPGSRRKSGGNCRPLRLDRVYQGGLKVYTTSTWSCRRPPN